MRLFDREHVVGVFRGFSQGGMEFHADLVLPYRENFQSVPMHGTFVLVQLEHEREAVFGRITTVASEGRLVSPIGEDYAIRAVRDSRTIPDDLRDQYLKYKTDIRVLGILREDGDKLIFAPSHRRLPHVGAKVAFLSPEVLKEVAGAGADASPDEVELGFLAFGEFVYAGADPRAAAEPWMVVQDPTILPRFQVTKLVSRRTFVFARAGFGKSNLMKLLFSELYRGEPTTAKRGGSQVPVGTLIFDPDGEYFWPDDKGRPALADVPHLADKLVVFTNRAAPSDYYGSFSVDMVRLDIRELKPAKVLAIALSPEKQDQQNVAKLKSLSTTGWRELVDLIRRARYGTDPARVKQLLGLPASDEAQVNAAISNMVRVVDALHDPASQLLSKLKGALTDGKLCVVDISQMRGSQGLQLAGVLLNHIFEHNQDEWTKAYPRTIPTIAVLEEAQSVLGGSAASEDSPFVSWVKEGRKYDLGAVLVTQQPGSIQQELVSQGDNFFVFHLLSAGDLSALKRANAHFSDDLLASLLNEPIVGNGIFWSSAPGTDRATKPYPLPVRVLSFTDSYRPYDPDFTAPSLDNYASRMRSEYARALEAAGISTAADNDDAESPSESNELDAGSALRQRAIDLLAEHPQFKVEVLQHRNPVKWGTVQSWLSQGAPAPPIAPDAFQWAYGVVVEAMDALLGHGHWSTERRPDPTNPASTKSWIVPESVSADVATTEPLSPAAEEEEPPF
jgi:hypothetical protein